MLSTITTILVTIAVMVVVTNVLSSERLQVAHAQVLTQPISSSDNGINLHFKNILQECAAAINAGSPNITKLQGCDQKVSLIRAECDKNQIGHSICDDTRLQDYINNRGDNNP